MYDAIVVGARCAGSPTAMLLARKGYRVLLVDRATFPSDIVNGYYIQQTGGSRLKRWGFDTHCPRNPSMREQDNIQVGQDVPPALKRRDVSAGINLHY